MYIRLLNIQEAADVRMHTRLKLVPCFPEWEIMFFYWPDGMAFGGRCCPRTRVLLTRLSIFTSSLTRSENQKNRSSGIKNTNLSAVGGHTFLEAQENVKN